MRLNCQIRSRLYNRLHIFQFLTSKEGIQDISIVKYESLVRIRKAGAQVPVFF